MVDLPRFDLFSGFPNCDAKWIQEVYGLPNARARMETLAVENPGHYFVFSPFTWTVVAQIDSTPRHDSNERPSKQQAD
jgi:hypothetical protein